MGHHEVNGCDDDGNPTHVHTEGGPASLGSVEIGLALAQPQATPMLVNVGLKDSVRK